jgi:MFS family permease
MANLLLTGPFARVTVANFFFFLNFASFFLLPLYVKALGGTEATVGFVMGSSSLASLLVLPVIGIALDRFGRRRFFVVGTLGMSAAACGYLFIDRIGPALFALRVVQGVSFAAAFTATTTLAAELAPRERRAQALGLFGVSTLLTHALAPAIGEEIIHRGGFHALFATAAACTMLPLLLIRGVPARRMPPRTQAHVPWAVSRLQWVVILTMTLAGMGFGAVVTFVPTFVRDAGLGRVGFFYGTYSVTAILTRVVGGGLSDSHGRRAVILPALLALAVSIFLVALAGNLPVLACVGALFGAAQGISYPTLHAYLVDLTPDVHMGRAQAFFNGSFNLGVMSSAFIFGPVADHIGQRAMFMCAALMPLVGGALFYQFGVARDRMVPHGTVPAPSVDVIP